MPKGTLFFVVGPSGAGKDSLISAACSERPGLLAMPRTITRPASNGEHIEVSPQEFAEMKRNGQFSLNWDAHGVRYGISKDLKDHLDAGISVIVNGSRGIVDDVRTDFSPIRIIHIVAPLDVLARRLRNRGREDEDEIDHRLGRSARLAPRGPDVVTIDNSGSLEDGVAAFLAALE